MTPWEWLDSQRNKAGWSRAPFSSNAIYGQRARLQNRFENERLLQDYLQLSEFSRADIVMRGMLELSGLTVSQHNQVLGVFFGLFPTKTVRGRVALTPRGDQAVLLHTGLMDSIEKMALFIPVFLKQNTEFVSLEDTNPILLNHLFLLARNWIEDLETVYCDLDYGLRMPEESWRRVDTITASTSAFIVGHELGHARRSDGYTNDTAQNHEIEFSADKEGLNYAVAVCFNMIFTGKADPGLILYLQLGPYFALALAGLIHGNDETSKHPSVRRRLESINESIMQSYEVTLRQNAEYLQTVEVTLPTVKDVGTRLVNAFLGWHQVVENIAKEAYSTQRPASVDSLFNHAPGASLILALQHMSFQSPEDQAASNGFVELLVKQQMSHLGIL